MVNDNLNLLKSIEQIHENICDECQRSSDFAPKEYQQCCQRIFNAAVTLYYDTLGILCHKTASGQKTNLPLSNLIELQKKVLNILQEPDNIINKEKLMQEQFIEQQISPENYFRLNDKLSGVLLNAIPADEG